MWPDPEKSLMENFIFSAVTDSYSVYEQLTALI